MTVLDLSDATRAAVSRTIDDIAEALQTPPPTHDGDPTLATSLLMREPGFAIFYAYLDRFRPDPRWRPLATSYLDLAMEHVPDIGHRPFLSYGFSGTGWALQHLARWYIELPADALDDLDEALQLLVEEAPLVSFDMQFGLVGFGLYALERMPHPAARRLLETILVRLERMAERRDGGLAWCVVNAPWVTTAWRDQLENLAVPGVFNGTAGVIGLLGGAIAAGVAVDAARTLLDGALTYLWSPRQRRGWRPIMSWARGAFGIVGATYAAATAADLPQWRDRAIRAAKSLELASSFRVAALADGIAGVAYTYYALHRLTGAAVFADRARTALTRLLRRRRPGSGLAGFRHFIPIWERKYLQRPELPAGWVGMPGLFDGVAGIGLTLLAMLDDRPPEWDRLMFLSYSGATSLAGPAS